MFWAGPLAGPFIFCHNKVPQFPQARSSGVERYLDTVEVGGSKPPVPTRIHVFQPKSPS